MINVKKLISAWVVPTFGFLMAAGAVSAWMEIRTTSRHGVNDRYANAVVENGTSAGAPIVSEYELDAASETNGNVLANSADIAKILCEYMPEVHVLHKTFDSTMSAVVWTNYLNSLDYERVYFLKSDIAEFEKWRDNLPELMKRGDVSFAKQVFSVFMARVQGRMQFVERNITNQFDYATDKTYCLKRDEMPWPADQAEQDDLWLRKIQNSLIASRVATRIANDKNTERKTALRLDIAREMHGQTDSTNVLSEVALADELKRFDSAVSALTQLPTNSTLRAAWCRVLVPSWQSLDPTTNQLASTTNQTATCTNTVAASATNKLESLVGQYVSAVQGIKTDAEADHDAAENTIKNYTQFESILKDSDEEFYLGKFFNAMTTAYDPHSNYLSPVAQEDFGIDMQLSLQGIGAQLQTDDGAAKIMEIIPGSPAERDTSEMHLVPGDRIIGVAQGDEEFVDIRHWPLYKAVRLIRGPKGSTVRLQVIPANDVNSIKIVTLVRDEIKLEEQAASSRVEKALDENGTERKLGYIKLPTFYSSMKLAGTADASPRSATLDVARLIADLNTENVEGVILDLRGNGGGSLPEAVYLTGLFIKTGPVVQVKESRRTITLPDNDPAIAYSKPLIVMIDRLSASASEIVAGALQDYGRAIIVGDSHTHGKGTVQTLLPVQNGKLGSLKATTASFYRITGSSTQIRGVASDICLPSIFEHFSELGEDKLPNAMPWSRTGPARYRRVDTLEDAVKALSEKSAARLAKNEKWQKHVELLDRFGALSTNIVVSMNFDERLKRAQEDEKLQHDISLDSSSSDAASDFGAVPDSSKVKNPVKGTKAEREAKAREGDVVLDETLNILVNFIDLHGAPQNLDGEGVTYDFLNTFFN